MRRYIILMCILAALEIGLALYITDIRKILWDFISSKDYEGFLKYLVITGVLGFIEYLFMVFGEYLQHLVGIKWREILNAKGLTLLHVDVDNINQRIQQDCMEYPTYMLNYGFGMIKALVYVVIFSTALVLKFDVLYLLALLGYVIIGTVVARRVGNPLVKLNYMSRKLEASYRRKLTEVNFQKCIETMLGLATKTRDLQLFQAVYYEIGAVLPLIIIAPAYFSTKMLLGSVMQAVSIMSSIIDHLSFGIYGFESINKLVSIRRRLKEVGIL